MSVYSSRAPFQHWTLATETFKPHARMKSFVSVALFFVIGMERELQRRRNYLIRQTRQQSKTCSNFAASTVFVALYGFVCVYAFIAQTNVFGQSALWFSSDRCPKSWEISIWNARKQHQKPHFAIATSDASHCSWLAYHNRCMWIFYFTHFEMGTQWRTMMHTPQKNSKDQRILFHSPWLAAYVVCLCFCM